MFGETLNTAHETRALPKTTLDFFQTQVIFFVVRCILVRRLKPASLLREARSSATGGGRAPHKFNSRNLPALRVFL
jgi:hypothetical protein